MHSSKRSPCELSHLLHNVDILLTPHGFQSMLLLFLPRPAILFEIFPYKYYKRGYGPLSGEYGKHILIFPYVAHVSSSISGIIHSGVMSPATLWHTRYLLRYIKTAVCMQWKHCRGYARNQDVM
jgi:hypothetical protein